MSNTESRGRCLIDGRPGEGVPVQDRGLHYGDGLFETCAVVDGRVPLWSRHLRRLRSGCERLRLRFPGAEVLAAERETVIGNVPNGTLKLILTRKEGGRGYGPPVSGVAADGLSETRRILCLYSPSPVSPPHGRDGIRVRLCHTRLARQPLLAGLKHLNRLEQVLARAEWSRESVAAGIPEGIMLDTDGWVVEGTMTNLFLVSDGLLLTPDLSQCGVAGVMRGWVLDRAAGMGIECREIQCSPAFLRCADEVFLCNSVAGIWPVVEFESSVYPVGPLTSRLADAVRTLFAPQQDSIYHESAPRR